MSSTGGVAGFPPDSARGGNDRAQLMPWQTGRSGICPRPVKNPRFFREQRPY